jgi:hypothetical protein
MVITMWWLIEILSCLSFLFVTGTQPFFKSKRVYEIVVPAAFSLLAVAMLYFYPEIFAQKFLKNFLGGTFQVMVFVVPFHLTALAVFATYQSPFLDQQLYSNSAQFKVWSNTDNNYFYKILTLRQYASLLFGYLCAIGVIYVVVYLFLSSIEIPNGTIKCKQYLHYIAVVLSIFFVIHYMTLTLYAITFLFDKINKVKSE